MKRWLSLLLAALLLLSLAACSQADAELALDMLDAVSSSLSDDTTDASPSTPEDALPDSQAPPVEEPLPADGWYDDRDSVALYLHLYGRLPDNFVTKADARSQYGWEGGPLDALAPGRAIGGSSFGNYEGLLPDAPGREWLECDIDTVGQTSRGAKRIVYSNDGLIYYTGDHYESFTLLYGGEAQ